MATQMTKYNVTHGHQKKKELGVNLTKYTQDL